MANNRLSKIYELNDIFSILGYTIFFMPLVFLVTGYNVIIDVSSMSALFESLFASNRLGNIISIALGVSALLIEKQTKYGTIGFNFK